MPGGYLQLVAIIGTYTLLVLWPPRRPRGVAVAVFFVTHLVNELPGLALVALMGGTALVLADGDLTSAGGLVLLAVAAVTAAGLLEITRRGVLTASVVARALERDLDPNWCLLASSDGQARWRRVVRELLAPLPLLPPNVERIKNVTYGEAGRRNRLDIYRRRGSAGGCGPVLVHFHGGHFQTGGKSREARPLLHRLSSQGWVCISAAYRLGTAGSFPNSQIDAKRVISWARSHAAEYGASRSELIVAGSSAGAHLAAMAALTPNDPAFQPGFEDANTSVTAAVCLYGYYGDRQAAGPLASSPEAYINSDAPPILVAHGDNDTLIPIDHADHFVRQLRDRSASPVVYLRLPGAQHSFDLFHSPRFESVIDAIEAFAAWSLSNPAPQRSAAQPSPPHLP
jgi:acetyl esterase/lipase